MTVINNFAPFGSRNQSTGCRRGPPRKHAGHRRRVPKRGTAQAQPLDSPLDSFSNAGLNLGSWNVRGGLRGDSGKLEALVLTASELHLGVVGLQEVGCRGTVEQVITDFWEQEWSLHVAGPSTGPRLYGTGFLVNPKFEVVSFTALSPRVSWIQIRNRTHHGPSGPSLGKSAHPHGKHRGTLCFVTCYAPTESNSSEQELDDFYSEVQSALRDARKSGGNPNVPVMGDFNIHLGSDIGGADIRSGVIGSCLVEGASSQNCGRFLAFSSAEGLSVVQTREHPSVLSERTRWSTWRHPGTGRPHLKDFVLIPLEDATKIRTCRPRWDKDIGSDHALVYCKVNSSRDAKSRYLWRKLSSRAPHCTGEPQLLQKRRGFSLESRVRSLDYASARKHDVQRLFKVALEEKVESLEPGWELTELALKETAVSVLKPLKPLTLGTWLTATATAELGSLIKQRSECRRLLSQATSTTASQLRDRLRGLKKATRLCVEKHKKAYRRNLVIVAKSSKSTNLRRQAMRLLAKGNDLSSDVLQTRQDVAPDCFKTYFENLFSRESQGETLGLTAERVGPKSAPKMELSGPPSLYEVQHACGRLRDGTAPGANGLRPEVFKAGGAILAHRLQQDFSVIWPLPRPGGSSDPSQRGDDTGNGDNPQGSTCWASSQADRVKVFQAWQDAEVVTLFKGKGARSDPSNYRGIFLLDVAGKVLATVIERRLRQAAEDWLSDSQNGFREKRSTSHSIHVLRRIQEACRSADLKAFAVFIDFEKVFDSPPRAALYECLDWIGVPSDLLAMIMAIHRDPKGKVSGTSVWFRVCRGVRQGCVLGPTMFIILLEFCKRMAELSNLGVRFDCVSKIQVQLPLDLSGAAFHVGTGEYADDMFLVDTSLQSLSAAMTRLQSVCGRIGLNISAGKTEWMYLHNPSPAEMEECRAQRTPITRCCDKIQILIGSLSKPIKHVSSFRYLGSIMSENGGVEDETRFRVLQAELSLNRYDGIWKSELTLRQKVRFLKTHVFPSLLYATECGNHTDAQLSQIAVFLNKCRRKLLNVGKCTADGSTISNVELQRRCRLPTPLDLLSRRRLNFIAKVVTRPTCHVARNMLFAEVRKEDVVRSVSGRARSSYLNILALDLRYLYSGLPAGRSLDDFLARAHRMGPADTKKVLMALKPDVARGCSLRLVAELPRPHVCHVVGCVAAFAELKGVYRHIRKAHPTVAAAQTVGPTGRVKQVRRGERLQPVNGDNSTGGERTEESGRPGSILSCTHSGCSRTFKSSGWLARHIKSCHGLAVPNNPTVPSSAVIADVGPTSDVGERALLSLAGRTPPGGAEGSPQVSVSSSGDGGAGRRGSRLRRPPRFYGVDI